ncbi:hypothetical protein D3C76_547060 [compost metagenome]
MATGLGGVQLTLQVFGAADGHECILCRLHRRRPATPGERPQGLPEVIAPGRRTDQQQPAPQRAQQRQRAQRRHTLQGRPRGPGQGDQPGAAQGQQQGLWQQAAQGIQGHGQEHEAEHALDQVHPRTWARQVAIAQRDQQQQRHAHAQAKAEQHQRALQHITTLRDVQQRTGQRGGHARAQQQARQRPEQCRAIQVAATGALPGAVEAVTHGGGQLQFEGAEHRQGQQHEQPRQAAQQPGLLQPGLQAGTQQGSNHPEPGVHQGHAQHIDPGQQPAAPGTGAIAQHQPGKDRQHRQRAGGEGQQQAKAEEGQQAPRQVALLQVAGQGLVAGLIGGRGHAATQVDGGGLRRVAQAGVGTALPAQAQLAFCVGRDQQFELVAVHRTVTEEFVMVVERRRQLRLLLGGQAVELQALLVEVVALLDLEE